MDFMGIVQPVKTCELEFKVLFELCRNQTLAKPH